MDKKTLNALHQHAKNLDILYVEDDKELQENAYYILKELFGKVDCSDNGSLGIEAYKKYYNDFEKYYDLVITDIKMPIMNGVDFAKRIKSINKEQKIIVTSAYDDSKYLIEFIDIGISKFIKKPFQFNNFLHSLYLVIKPDKDDYILVQNISWDKKRNILFEDNEQLHLSNNELQVIKLFFENPNQIFSKYDLLNVISEESSNKEFSEDIVKSIIKRLRKKLPDGLIENLYGRGYKLNL